MNPRKQQEMENDLAFLKDRFQAIDSEIKLPHSLSAEMMRYKLEHIDLIVPDAPKRRQPVWLKPLMGLTACFVLAFGAFQLMNRPEMNQADQIEGPMLAAGAPASSAANAPAAAPAAAPEAVAFGLDAEEGMAIPDDLAAAPTPEDAVAFSTPVPEEISDDAPEPIVENAPTPVAESVSEAEPDTSFEPRSVVTPRETDDADDGLVISPKERSNNSTSPRNDSGRSASSERGTVDAPASAITDTNSVQNAPQSQAEPSAAPASLNVNAEETHPVADLPANAATSSTEATSSATPSRKGRMADVPELPPIPKASYAKSYADVATSMLAAQGGIEAYRQGGPATVQWTPTAERTPQLLEVSNESHTFTYAQNRDGSTIVVSDKKTDTQLSTLPVESDLSQLYLYDTMLVTLEADEAFDPQNVATSYLDWSMGELAGTNARRNVQAMNASVAVTIYDIEDPEKVVPVNAFAQDGQLTGSRLEQGTLYLASDRPINVDLSASDIPMRELVPLVASGVNGTPRLLAADEIVLASTSDPRYSVVTALNVKNGKAKTTAVLGAKLELLGETGFYFTNTVTNPEPLSGIMSIQSTHITKLSKSLESAETGRVYGNLQLPGALDDSDGGYLRVAALADYPSGESKNNLYVLDKRMRQISQLNNFAPERTFQSVEFTSDCATFTGDGDSVQIDLSNPANPKLK